MEVTIPHNYTPREYQKPLFNAISQGYKRIIQIWHRRSGKDKTDINIVAKEMFKRIGTYYYFFPTYAQGMKVLWNGRDKNGFRHIDHIPIELRKRVDNTQMLIETTNGSIFQVVGTDNIDSIVGTNPVGCVFSEFSLQNPTAWQYIRPILAENDGWAIFNFTPRGKNHAYELYESAKVDPKWFVSLLTVNDTKALSEEVLEQEKKEMNAQTGDDALYNQEYFVSFNAPLQGAYYASQMQLAEQEGRITQVPYNPAKLVHTAWDLGSKNNAIWLFQEYNGMFHFIDFVPSYGKSMPEYIATLKEKPYVYGDHFGPHDLEESDYGSGKTRVDIAKELGFRFKIVPKIGVDDGIEAGRNIFSRCRFDAEKCKEGLNALASYHASYSDRLKTFRDYPEHDWSSHASDAFRYFAVGVREEKYIDRDKYHSETVPLNALTNF